MQRGNIINPILLPKTTYTLMSSRWGLIRRVLVRRGKKKDKTKYTCVSLEDRETRLSIPYVSNVPCTTRGKVNPVHYSSGRNYTLLIGFSMKLRGAFVREQRVTVERYLFRFTHTTLLTILCIVVANLELRQRCCSVTHSSWCNMSVTLEVWYWSNTHLADLLDR